MSKFNFYNSNLRNASNYKFQPIENIILHLFCHHCIPHFKARFTSNAALAVTAWDLQGPDTLQNALTHTEGFCWF